MDLVLVTKRGKGGAVPERVRADNVDLVEVYVREMRVAGKGVIFNDGDTVGDRERRVCFFVIGILNKAREYDLLAVRGEGSTVKHAVFGSVIRVVGVCCEGREAIHVAEGAIPNGGCTLGLALTDKRAKGDALCRLVAKERIAVKADHAEKAVVVGNEIGDHDLFFRGARGVDEVFLALVGFLTDDRRVRFKVYGIVNAVLILVAREGVGGVKRGMLDQRFPSKCGGLINDDASAVIKGRFINRDGYGIGARNAKGCISNQIDLCGAAAERARADRTNAIYAVGIGADDDGPEGVEVFNFIHDLECIFGDACDGIAFATGHDLQRNANFARCIRQRRIVIHHGLSVDDLVMNTILVKACRIDIVDLFGAFQRVINARFGDGGRESFAGDKANVGISVMGPAASVCVVREEKIIVCQLVVGL